MPSGGPSSNSSFYFDFASASPRTNAGKYQQKGAHSRSRPSGEVPFSPVDKRRFNNANSTQMTLEATNRKRPVITRHLTKFTNDRSSFAKSPAAKRKAVDEKLTTDTTSDAVSDKLSEQTTSIINDILRGGEPGSSNANNVTNGDTNGSNHCGMLSKGGEAAKYPKTTQQSVPGKAPEPLLTSRKRSTSRWDSTPTTSQNLDERHRMCSKDSESQNKNSEKLNNNLKTNILRRSNSPYQHPYKWNGPGLVRKDTNSKDSARSTQMTDKGAKQATLPQVVLKKVLPLRETDDRRCDTSNNGEQSAVQGSSNSPGQLSASVTSRSADCSTYISTPLLPSPSNALPKKPLLPNPRIELSKQRTFPITSMSSCSTAKTNLIKVGLTPRSRREQIELEQMMREHASRKTSGKLQLPTHLRSSMPDNINFNAADVVITTVDQDELRQEIGFDFSILDENLNSTVSSDCVMIDDESNQSFRQGGHDVALLSNETSHVARPVDSDCVLVSPLAIGHERGPVGFGQNDSTSSSILNSSKTISSQLPNSSCAMSFDSSRACARVSQGAASSLQVAVGTTDGVFSPPLASNSNMAQHMATEHTTEASVALPALSGNNEQGSLSTILQITLQEEKVVKELTMVTRDIEQIRMQVMTLKSQLEARLHMRTMVSEIFLTVY